MPTISWGLSLIKRYTIIAETYVLRWIVDAARLPKSKAFIKVRPLLEKAFAAPPRRTLAGRYGESPSFRVSSNNEYTVMSFLDALFTAKSQEPLPSFLWSTVNVMPVDINGQSAQRLGVGKVIFGAWFIAAMKREPEDIIFE